MKKILTFSAIAIIFASNFATASTVSTGNGGKVIFSATVKTSKVHYTKISAKEFSLKAMQDTKDILMQSAPVQNIANFFTTKAA